LQREAKRDSSYQLCTLFVLGAQGADSGKTPVLILDSVGFVGARQNRIANVTILVPPQSGVPNLPRSGSHCLLCAAFRSGTDMNLS